MGMELPRRGSGVAMVITSPFPEEKGDSKRRGRWGGSFPEEGCVAMVITSPFPEEIGDSFPNEEENGSDFTKEGGGWPWSPPHPSSSLKRQNQPKAQPNTPIWFDPCPKSKVEP